MELSRRSVGELEPHPDNPRTHPDELIQKLQKSMDQFGWTNPILITPDGKIIAGHARLKAARERGDETVPVVELDLEGEAAEQYMIADNKIAELSSWNTDRLARLMDGFEDPDVQAMGFDRAEVEQLLDQDLDGSVDEPPLPDLEDAPARIEVGEAVALGPHRLLCGDATDPANIERLLDGLAEDPRLCVTDPPYGVGVDHTWRDETSHQKDYARQDQLEGDDNPDWGSVYNQLPTDILYVWHAADFADVVKRGMEEAGFDVRQQIIWVKKLHTLSRAHYHWKHEPCWYAVKKGANANWIADRTQMTVWEHPSPIQEFGPQNETVTPHPTQKPIELYLKPIRNHLPRGEALIDPFAGSGQALIAAEKSDRVCFAIELDPTWASLMIERWEDLTGGSAEPL